MTRLALGGNEIGGEGARALAASPYLRSLTALEVSADGIDEEAGALLFDRFGEVLQDH